MSTHTMSSDRSAASPVPTGYTTLTPFFCVDGAERAIEFYCAVLDGHVVGRNDNPDGSVAHCEIGLPSGRMQLSDPSPTNHLVAASGEDDVSRSTVAYVADVDRAYARAVELGAKGYGEPETFVTGDRFAAFLDPWGHRWAIMTRVEDVSPEEADRRVNEWLASQGAGDAAASA